MTSTPRTAIARRLLAPIAAAALLVAPMSGCHGHRSHCGGSDAAGFALLAGVVALAVIASDCDDGHHHDRGRHSHGHSGYDRCR